MNRTWLARIGVALLVVAAMFVVAGIAYRIGDDGGRLVDVGPEVVIAPTGTRTMVGGLHHGWWGPGFGFLFFPLAIVGLILLFRSRRDRWDGPPWRGEEQWRDWHRRQHVADVPVQDQVQDGVVTTAPAPPPPGDVPPPTPPAA